MRRMAVGHIFLFVAQEELDRFRYARLASPGRQREIGKAHERISPKFLLLYLPQVANHRWGVFRERLPSCNQLLGFYCQIWPPVYLCQTADRVIADLDNFMIELPLGPIPDSVRSSFMAEFRGVHVFLLGSPTR